MKISNSIFTSGQQQTNTWKLVSAWNKINRKVIATFSLTIQTL